MKDISSYITMPKGYRASGISADLKGGGKPDLALIVSDVPCSAAGVHTSNLVKGHSLTRSINLINSGNKIRGVVINSKNANACVGPAGSADAESVAAAVAGELGCSPDEILTASTGVIGIRLPIEKILCSVKKLTDSLSSEEVSAHNATQAIMTTDSIPKEVSAVISLNNGKEFRIAAIAKGSGMIHPSLATMISVFTTDADVSSELLDKALRRAAAHSFNRVSVDGDTSVCDSVMIFANGLSGISVNENTEEYELFESALCSLSDDLARMIAADGEGATKFVEINVDGALNEYDAKLIVTAVARSPLCKTAIFGEDANWGRIITAVGYSGAKFNPDKTDIELNGLSVCKNGCADIYREEEASELLKQHDIVITIHLHEGNACDRMYTCDFSYDYVKINGSYRS